MDKNLKLIVESNLRKFSKALLLLKASLKHIDLFDPSEDYTAEEREPFDALASRFERVVELALKAFKSIEIVEYGKGDSTLRDLLNHMEKLDLVSKVAMWMDMREVRNKIAHDYLPEEIEKIYQKIKQRYYPELSLSEAGITKYFSKKKNQLRRK